MDDFLANGRALEGLMEIAAQAGAEVVGAACAIEKGFQHGGDRLRAQGVRVESLAIVESMDENGLPSAEEGRAHPTLYVKGNFYINSS